MIVPVRVKVVARNFLFTISFGLVDGLLFNCFYHENSEAMSLFII